MDRPSDGAEGFCPLASLLDALPGSLIPSLFSERRRTRASRSRTCKSSNGPTDNWRLLRDSLHRSSMLLPAIVLSPPSPYPAVLQATASKEKTPAAHDYSPLPLHTQRLFGKISSHSRSMPCPFHLQQTLEATSEGVLVRAKTLRALSF